MNQEFISLSVERSAVSVSEDLFPFHEASSTPLVLVADDNEIYLLFMKRLIESKGFECVTTTSPTTAIRIAVEKRPSVVICDINFGIGKTTGLDVFTEIRRMNAAMPFVIISAFIQPEIKQRATSLGITDYITKPIDPAQLIATIQNLVGNKRVAL